MIQITETPGSLHGLHLFEVHDAYQGSVVILKKAHMEQKLTPQILQI